MGWEAGLNGEWLLELTCEMKEVNFIGVNYKAYTKEKQFTTEQEIPRQYVVLLSQPPVYILFSSHSFISAEVTSYGSQQKMPKWWSHLLSKLEWIWGEWGRRLGKFCWVCASGLQGPMVWFCGGKAITQGAAFVAHASCLLAFQAQHGVVDFLPQTAPEKAWSLGLPKPAHILTSSLFLKLLPWPCLSQPSVSCHRTSNKQSQRHFERKNAVTQWHSYIASEEPLHRLSVVSVTSSPDSKVFHRVLGDILCPNFKWRARLLRPSSKHAHFSFFIIVTVLSVPTLGL